MIGNTELKIFINIQKKEGYRSKSPITGAKTVTVNIFNI